MGKFCFTLQFCTLQGSMMCIFSQKYEDRLHLASAFIEAPLENTTSLYVYVYIIYFIYTLILDLKRQLFRLI